MTAVPEFVYVITVDTEWPVDVIADCHPATPGVVERQVAKRMESPNAPMRHLVHIWKARLTDVREVDLVPASVVEASLRERAEPADG